MTKKTLVGIVNAVVSQVAVAHGLPEGAQSEDAARTLLGLAIGKNAALLVAATSPPVAEVADAADAS